MNRRTLLSSAVAGSASLIGRAAFAQRYPTRPIRWVMPFPAGGPTDAVARALAEQVSTRLGQVIFIDNKPGANGSIGTAEVARSSPDGYTFAFAINDSLISVASLIKSVPYDARTDLTPIMKFAESPLVLVASSKLGVRTLPELLDAAHKAPGKIAYGTWGPGTAPHIITKSLEGATGTQFLDIPYRGVAPLVPDLLANAISLTFLPPTMADMFQEKGLTTSLAITGAKRSPYLPSVPAFPEHGVDTPLMRTMVWNGLVGPKGLPEPIIARWTEVLSEAVRTPQFDKFLRTMGLNLVAHGPQEFGRELAAEYDVTNSFIQSLGIKPQ